LEREEEVPQNLARIYGLVFWSSKPVSISDMKLLIYTVKYEYIVWCILGIILCPDSPDHSCIFTELQQFK